MNNILSIQDEEFLGDIKDLSEEKKNGILAYLKNKLEANNQRVFSVEEITIKTRTKIVWHFTKIKIGRKDVTPDVF